MEDLVLLEVVLEAAITLKMDHKFIHNGLGEGSQVHHR